MRTLPHLISMDGFWARRGQWVCIVNAGVCWAGFAGCSLSDPTLLPSDEGGVDSAGAAAEDASTADAAPRRDAVAADTTLVDQTQGEGGPSQSGSATDVGASPDGRALDAGLGSEVYSPDGSPGDGAAAVEACAVNACGGCSVLAGAPGSACGMCGQYACDPSTGGVKCNDLGLNACGGCGTLAGAPNATCGNCGTFVCSADKTAVSCSDPGLNACSGCGMLSAAPGAACGTCGMYVCNTGNTAVTCNDPGTTNNCPTWCSSHPAPNGVAANDYQCVDFDKGSLPSAWTQTLAKSGTMSVSTTLADSTPDSLKTSTTANSADTATLAWSDPGSATNIKSLSLIAAIDPVTAPQIVPSGSSGIDLLKIATSGGELTVSLEYVVNGTDPTSGNSGYTGLFVYWVIVAGAAVSGTCAVSVDWTLNAWNSMELDVDLTNAAINVIINGTTATSGCAGAMLADTAAIMTVGANSPSSDTFSWTGYFDNIQAIVRR